MSTIEGEKKNKTVKYAKAWTPMERWEQELFEESSWNAILGVNMYTKTGQWSDAAIKQGRGEGTDAGTWYPSRV